MSRALKSFADFSLKAVTVRAAADSDFRAEFTASRPQSTPSALTAPPRPPIERRRDPLGEVHTWHHGGINE